MNAISLLVYRAKMMYPQERIEPWLFLMLLLTLAMILVSPAILISSGMKHREYLIGSHRRPSLASVIGILTVTWIVTTSAIFTSIMLCNRLDPFFF